MSVESTNASQTVLLLGATGRTGRRVLEQLLARGVNVRAIVRSARRLPASASGHPNLTSVESEVLSMSDEDLTAHLRGADAVISCLGHVLSLKGVYGPPRDLVTRAVTRICSAIESLRPAHPVRLVLMSSVSVNHPGGSDTRRGMIEKACVWAIRGVLPPARDNQLAADYLFGTIGVSNPFVQWVAVRPDTLIEGNVTNYAVHKNLVSSLIKPDSSTMANVAHFMCELALDPALWTKWEGRMPVLTNCRT